MYADLSSSQPHLLSPRQADFPQYGFLWYLFAEFIPRGISAVALMHLMRNTNEAKKKEKFTTGRYALSSSLTSAKKADFSLRHVRPSPLSPPPPLTSHQSSASTNPSVDENRQTLGDSLMNYQLSSDSDAPSLIFEPALTLRYQQELKK